MAGVRVVGFPVLTVGCVFAFLAGCGSDESTPTPMPQPDAGFITPDSGVDGPQPAVDLGAGLTAYRDLALSGASVELVRGPQGGWHIDLGVRVRNFEPIDLGLTYTATTSDRTFAEVRYEVRNSRKFRPTGEGWVRPGDQVIFDIVDPSEVVDRMVTVSVELNVGALSLRDSRQVTVVDNE